MRVNPVALRALRERSGLTVTALAHAAGIRQPHLSNVELGRRNVSPPVALAIAEALKVDVAAILAEPSGTVAA